MAKGRLMLQIEVEQSFGAPVTDLPGIWAVALDWLDGDRTVVREIATEKSQAMYLWATESGYESGEFALSDNALSDLWLVFPDLRKPPKILHAPSHVPSPPFDGARLVLLRVRDYGFGVDSPGLFSTVRWVSSHAYVDETPAT
jgi:hypothetical protein